MHNAADRAAASTCTRPQAVGMDGWCYGHGARALRAAAGCVGWRGNDRGRSLHRGWRRLQKPIFDVRVRAKSASGDLMSTEGPDRMAVLGRCAMSGFS